MNDLAIKLIEREINKKEKQLTEVLTLLTDNPAEEYGVMLAEVNEKIEQKQNGKLSASEFTAFLREAAKREASCMHRLDPKLRQRQYDKRYKLQADIDSLRQSLWRLS